MDYRPLSERSTAERTDEELERCYELYVQSKTVNGRLCPTPDFRLDSDDDDCETERRKDRASRVRSSESKKNVAPSTTNVGRANEDDRALDGRQTGA